MCIELLQNSQDRDASLVRCIWHRKTPDRNVGRDRTPCQILLSVFLTVLEDVEC